MRDVHSVSSAHRLSCMFRGHAAAAESTDSERVGIATAAKASKREQVSMSTAEKTGTDVQPLAEQNFAALTSVQFGICSNQRVRRKPTFKT